MRKRCDLKKKLRVTFVGEAGLDMGGLTKEWFLLLVRQIFHTDYGETHFSFHTSLVWDVGKHFGIDDITHLEVVLLDIILREL